MDVANRLMTATEATDRKTNNKKSIHVPVDEGVG